MPLVSITYMRDDHLFKKINSTKMYTHGHPVLFSRVQKLIIQKIIIIKRVDLDLRNTSQLNPCRYRKALSELRTPRALLRFKQIIDEHINELPYDNVHTSVIFPFCLNHKYC